MTPDEPKVGRTSRYSVMQTSRLLGIDRKTLYKYTDQGRIRCHYRPDLTKFYLGRDILALWKAEL